VRAGRSARPSRQRRYREFRHFLALRACREILTGGSVAWGLDFTAESEFQALGNGLFTADCTVGGKPLGPEHLYHGDPERQER
jgi:hypothetical protein